MWRFWSRDYCLFLIQNLFDDYVDICEINVIDKNNDWQNILSAILSYHTKIKNIRSKLHRKHELKFKFHAMNLLLDEEDISSYKKIQKLIKNADTVLLLYGLTELYDINRVACKRCFRTCNI